MIEFLQTYLLIGLILYLFPFIISVFTGNRTGPVFVMNLFLGWTFIGWVWALIWAVTSDRKTDQVIVHNHISSDNRHVQESQKIIEALPNEALTDKTTLFNQLSQLYSLKEKKVITEEIYEQEKTILLDKLEGNNKNVDIIEQIAEDFEIHVPSIQEENKDLTYEQLFNRKKWYKKPVFYFTLLLALVSFFIYYFLFNISTSLPKPYSDTSAYQLDSSINSITIDGGEFALKVVKQKANLQLTSIDGEETYLSLIFIFLKGRSKNIFLTKAIPKEEGEYLNYRIYKGQDQSLNNGGRLYLLVNSSFGGSGSSSTIYTLNYQNDALTIQELFEKSGELDYVFYHKNDKDVLILRGIWDDNESHFDNHRYLVEKYSFENGSFNKTEIGKTRHKYSSLDGGKEPQEILAEIKRKEPNLMTPVFNTDYH